MFAISASTTDAKNTLQLMKDTLHVIISTFGSDNIHYAVMVYGTSPRTIFSFQETFPNVDVLLERIKTLPTERGIPNLHRALDEAKKAFESTGARPNAKKILVVMTDSDSSSREEDVLKAAESLDGDGIKVIPVAVGDEVDPEGLESITPMKGNIIEASTNENPKNVGKKITDKMRESK